MAGSAGSKDDKKDDKASDTSRDFQDQLDFLTTNMKATDEWLDQIDLAQTAGKAVLDTIVARLALNKKFDDLQAAKDYGADT